MRRDDRLVRLSWDHHHALAMARRILLEVDSATNDGLAGLYSDLVGFWSAGLLPHFRAEQECLLARLIRHVAPEDPAVTRTHSDHLYLEALVATMRDQPDIETRREALRRFAEALRAHVRWEEATLFALTQERCDDDDLDAMAADFEDQLPPLAPAPMGERPTD